LSIKLPTRNSYKGGLNAISFFCCTIIIYGSATTGGTRRRAGARTKCKNHPLGTHDGDMCRHDRALLFEAPDGKTVLFDAGRTVAGAKDPRLPK
jgi:hypothetical protein